MTMHKLLFLFNENNIPISWKTVLVGRKLKLADNLFVEDFATNYLLENSTFQNLSLIELAYGVKNEFDVNDILNKIYQDFAISIDEETPEWDIEVRKWRYLLLKQLTTEKYNNRKLLDEIESIYCDFGHSEDLEIFILYMPSPATHGYDFAKHSAQENITYLVNHFCQFLDKEQHELSSKNC